MVTLGHILWHFLVFLHVFGRHTWVQSQAIREAPVSWCLICGKERS